MELEQQEIFHNKDDTLVSKLQNQIVKLIHILNVSWGSADNYANIEQYKDVDGNAQHWWIDVCN